MAMKPFELLVNLKTPVVLGRHPLRLDGLLWHCLYLDLGDPELAQKALPEYLSFSEGMYHASSCALASKTPEKKLALDEAQSDRKSEAIHSPLAIARATVGNMARTDLHERYFQPFGSQARMPYPKVVVNGGPYISRLNAHKAYWCDGLLFHGNGEGPRIAELMEFYLAAVGVNANIGFGTIGVVLSRPCETDKSLVGDDGKPARPIPVRSSIKLKDKESISVSEAIVNPPFRHQAQEPCYMPDRIRTTRIKIPFQQGDTQ